MEVQEASYYADDESVVREAEAFRFAKEVAEEAVEHATIEAKNEIERLNQVITTMRSNEQYKVNTNGGLTMSQLDVTKEELKNAANDIVTESMTNAKLIGGEILLDNIKTVAERLILSRLSWWKKLMVSRKDTDLAITIAVYGIVYAIRSGGFGLTKYKINHPALEYVTLAANKEMLKYLVGVIGVNTNIAETFLEMPSVVKVGA